MKKKEYKDVTYGMKYKEFSKILSRKMMLVKDCKGYEKFKADIKILRDSREICGKATLLANYWMRSICNMSKQDLIKLVDNYQEGYFNPYQFAPEQEKFNSSNEDEEEEENGL